MIKMFVQQKGSIALTAVIAMSSILLLAGITLVLTSIDFARSTKSYENTFRAQLNTNSCLEEALYRLGTNRQYTGSISVSDDGNSCSATVTTNAQNPNYKDVAITSTVDVQVNNVTYQVDTSSSQLMIVK